MPTSLEVERGLTKTISISEELAKLPTQPVAALRVLRMVDDPRASAAALGRLVEVDPGLSTKVMRLANSPYYGLSGKVASAAQATVLLGFSTVRALAASAAAGLLVDQQPVGPPGFWSHAVLTAAGSSAVARRVGGQAANAFTAGLLHDIGRALFFRIDQQRFAQIDEAVADGMNELAAERELFGTDHAEAGGRVLDEWRFPASLSRAIAAHHESLDTMRDGLARIVVAGEALGARCEPDSSSEPLISVEDALEAVGESPAAIPRLIAEVRHEVASLAGFLREMA